MLGRSLQIRGDSTCKTYLHVLGSSRYKIIEDGDVLVPWIHLNLTYEQIRGH